MSLVHVVGLAVARKKGVKNNLARFYSDHIICGFRLAISALLGVNLGMVLGLPARVIICNPVPIHGPPKA